MNRYHFVSPGGYHERAEGRTSNEALAKILSESGCPVLYLRMFDLIEFRRPSDEALFGGPDRWAVTRIDPLPEPDWTA